MVELTSAAQAAIADVMAQAGGDVVGLRIAVAMGGCSGLQYRMGLETATDGEDTIIVSGKVRVLVDSISLHWLKGATIDFRQGETEAGFVIDNPNAAGLCSCGKSSCC